LLIHEERESGGDNECKFEAPCKGAERDVARVAFVLAVGIEIYLGRRDGRGSLSDLKWQRAIGPEVDGGEF